MTDASGSPFEDETSLGELLREARESRGLDLSDVARLTHVRRDYLAALEEGRYDDLPEDVYTRNFLRLYAQAVGVDVVRAQEIYRAERRSSAVYNTMEERLERESESAAEVVPARDSRGRNRPALRLPGRLTAALSTLLMVGAVVALALWGFNSTFFKPGRNVSSQPAGAAAPADAGAEGQDSEPEVLPRTVRLSVTSSPPGAEVTIDEFPLPGVTPISGAPVTARPSRTIRVSLEGYQPYEGELDLTFDRNISVALSPLSQTGLAAQDEDGAAGTDEGDGTTDTEGASGEPAAEGAEGAGEATAPAGQPQATLRITEDTWLEVYQGTARNQGQRLAFTTARAGQTLTFPLPIYIHAGNAGGVELVVAGQERGALGSAGEVRGLAVTR